MDWKEETDIWIGKLTKKDLFEITSIGHPVLLQKPT